MVIVKGGEAEEKRKHIKTLKVNREGQDSATKAASVKQRDSEFCVCPALTLNLQTHPCESREKVSHCAISFF